MDVRETVPGDRPERGRAREEGGGKSSVESRREAGPGARPPRTSRPAGSFSGTVTAGTWTKSLLKSPILLPRLPTPRCNLSVPHLSALCVNSEDS